MANPEHLKILTQGVEAWNRWRQRQPDLAPDLSFIADLRGRSLRAANLSCASLEGSPIWRADLQQANLSKANLHLVDLTGTDLRQATLSGASLYRNNLAEANLAGSVMSATLLNDLDLSQARSLSQVLHKGPSTVGTDTLENTAAGLADNPAGRAEVETFLRGAGVPESIMSTFAVLATNPIETYSGFISYSHTDNSFARRLYTELQARGVRCWLDEHDLKPGDRILDVVDEAIRLHDRILLCCSEASLVSWWVKDEIRKAQERERRDGRDIIIPLMVDRYLLDGWEDGLAADLRSRLAADFTGWENDNAKFEEQFERVVEALRTDEGARERAPEPKL